MSVKTLVGLLAFAHAIGMQPLLAFAHVIALKFALVICMQLLLKFVHVICMQLYDSMFCRGRKGSKRGLSACFWQRGIL